MARALNLADIIIIAILIIIAAVLIYLLRPLIIVIVIISAGYFIYRWYIKRKLLRSWLFVDRKRARKIFSLLNIYFKLLCSNQASYVEIISYLIRNTVILKLVHYIYTRPKWVSMVYPKCFLHRSISSIKVDFHKQPSLQAFSIKFPFDNLATLSCCIFNHARICHCALYIFTLLYLGGFAENLLAQVDSVVHLIWRITGALTPAILT